MTKYEYALSPSGRFLLRSEQAPPSTALRLFIFPVTSTKLERAHDVSPLAFDSVHWSFRSDVDQLIGTRKGRLYHVILERTPPHVTPHHLTDITPPASLRKVKILRYPRNPTDHLIISAIDGRATIRTIYGCRIHGPAAPHCLPIAHYDALTYHYHFPQNSNVILRRRWNPTHRQLLDLELAKGPIPVTWQKVLSYDPTNTVLRLLDITLHGGAVMALSNRGREYVALVRLHLADGREEIVSRFNADVDEVFLNSYTGDVLATSASAVLQKPDFLDSSLERILAHLLRRTSTPLKTEILSTDSSGTLFVSRFRLAEAGHATVLVRATGHAELLNRTPSQPAAHGAKPYEIPKSIAIAASDGPSVRGFLTTPTRGPGPYPFVIMIHGGPRAHYGWHLHPLVQALVSLDIAVLQLNYRGSSGYGKTYQRFIVRAADPFTSVLHDVDLAYHWLVSNGLSRAGEVALWGESFGTTVAVATARRFPRRYRAVALLGGLFDFTSYMKHVLETPPGQRKRLLADLYQYFGVQSTSDVLAKTQYIDPCKLAAGHYATTLIFAATEDRVTHPDHSVAFYDELRARGNNAQLNLLLHDGHNHRLALRQSIVKYMAESATFFHQSLNETRQEERTEMNSYENGNAARTVERCLTPKRGIRDVMAPTAQ